MKLHVLSQLRRQTGQKSKASACNTLVSEAAAVQVWSRPHTLLEMHQGGLLNNHTDAGRCFSRLPFNFELPSSGRASHALYGKFFLPLSPDLASTLRKSSVLILPFEVT